MRSSFRAGVAVAAATALMTPAAMSTASPETSSGDDPSTQPLQRGVQTAPKLDHRTSTTIDGETVHAANPYLALVPDPTEIDWKYWRDYAAQQSEKRDTARQRGVLALAVPDPFTHTEQEPAGASGENDTQADAERIDRFGLDRNEHNAVTIQGELSAPRITVEPLTTTEDQGSIPLATETGISDLRGGVTVTSAIGDGPYGSSAAGSGDFDFFHLTADAGKTITVDTAGSDMDTIVALYTPDGEIVTIDDDGGPGFDSFLQYTSAEGGEYYVAIAGWRFGNDFPADPFDSSSGLGAGSEGPYVADITVSDQDQDFYAVYLEPGDTVGGTVDGAADEVSVHRYDGQDLVSSRQDASFIYPTAKLPGGGNAAFAYVAEEAGWYAVSTGPGVGSYQMLLEVYQPGSKLDARMPEQTIFVDFDGARVNTAEWGGTGVRTLSPMSDWLSRWGLTAADEDALIDQVMATIKENVRQDLVERGLAKKIRVTFLNSRDHADPWGQENVSRLIVGGSRAESGINTIGIASSIDPGNYEHEDQALILLDVLSAPASFGPASLNSYIEPGSDTIGFIGTAVGNVASHEAGHYIGSFHVDQFNDIHNLMDQGGNFDMLYGVGPDLVGGTSDDVDVDFGEDVYNPNEGFTGWEDTLNFSTWAHVQGKGKAVKH